MCGPKSTGACHPESRLVGKKDLRPFEFRKYDQLRGCFAESTLSAANGLSMTEVAHRFLISSVLSQKLVQKSSRMLTVVREPRQGRQSLAHGVSRGFKVLSPHYPPSPAKAGEGKGGEGGTADPDSSGLHSVARRLTG